MTTHGRILVLAAGFLGWMFAGVQLGVTSLVMRDATLNLLGPEGEGEVGKWAGWLVASFMLGGALGGYLFGWLGDKFGRRNAMASSIACYSIFVAITYFAQSSNQLLWLRFATGLGVGGMWPNAIALVSEAWPKMSKPFLAGIIGTAANVGIMLFSILAIYEPITPDAWRWTMLVCATPIVLAVFVLMIVPESPQWLSLKIDTAEKSHEPKQISPLVEVFQPPILRITLVGIMLGTIPLFGGWGSTNWANFWASQVGQETQTSAEESDPGLKGRVLLARSAPGSLSSLLGGALAAAIGRRRCYFLLSLGCLICSQYLFRFSHPSQGDFMYWYAALGLLSGFFFGWLPFCLPELFPTRIRSTGAGVSFNFGRIATVVGILVAAGMLKDWFDGDYARIGSLTSWIYAFGMVIVWFIPTKIEDANGPN